MILVYAMPIYSYMTVTPGISCIHATSHVKECHSYDTLWSYYAARKVKYEKYHRKQLIKYLSIAIHITRTFLQVLYLCSLNPFNLILIVLESEFLAKICVTGLPLLGERGCSERFRGGRRVTCLKTWCWSPIDVDRHVGIFIVMLRIWAPVSD